MFAVSVNEFQAAVVIAKTSPESISYDGIWDWAGGFGLSGFSPVVCSLVQFASLVHYQARMFNGGWDNEALTELYNFRSRFIIAG